MEPALFSPCSLFSCEADNAAEEENAEDVQTFVEREHSFPSMVLVIREFSFHLVNANLLWPGTPIFAEWLIEHQNLLRGRQIIELGSGTGALAIFLKKSLAMDITTSDYDDKEIEENIAYNCVANGISVLSHVRHTWGENFPIRNPNWDLIIASDILLYVKQYANLIQSLIALLTSYRATVTNSSLSQDETCEHRVEEMELDVKRGNQLDIESDTQHCKTVNFGGNFDNNVILPRPCFLMSWRRRIPKEDEECFFKGCENAGLRVKHVGSRVFCIFLANS